MFSKKSSSVDSLHQRMSYHRFIKLLFIAISTLLVVGVFTWPYIEKFSTLFILSKAKIDIDGIDLKKKEIKNPRFLGGKDQPYTITAKYARQISDTKVLLESVKGRLSLKDSTTLFILADKADLTTDQTKCINLLGNVNFMYDKGNFEIWTQSAFSNLHQGYSEGKEFVEGESDHGTFTGQGFYLNQREKTLKLTGPASLVIYPRRASQKEE